jgi:hypothetical protein
VRGHWTGALKVTGTVENKPGELKLTRTGEGASGKVSLQADVGHTGRYTKKAVIPLDRTTRR